jgi:hypothetical protein
MLKSFIEDVKIYQLNCGATDNGVSGGAVTTTSNPVDMTAFESVCFVANFIEVLGGTSGANLYLMYSCSSGGTFHDIAGTAIQCGSSNQNFYLASDLVKVLPDQKWIAAGVAVPSTSSRIGAVTAYQYSARNYPVTQATCNYIDINISATSGTI